MLPWQVTKITKITKMKYYKNLTDMIYSNSQCSEFSHHVHRYLTDWGFAMLLFEVLDPALFFRDEVCQDVF